MNANLATTTPRGAPQCDPHRRAAEVEACRLANKQARQSDLNRTEWLRRADCHDMRGEIEIANNIRDRVRDIDARPGHSH